MQNDEVRLGLFSAIAETHIRNIMEFITHCYSSEINSPTRYTASKVLYNRATNGELVAKSNSGWRYSNYITKSSSVEEFYAKYANCFKRAALISLYRFKDYTGQGWLRTNITHVINNGTTIRDAYFLYEFFKHRPNLEKKYGSAYVNETIGHENDPFLTEQNETRLRLIAELKNECETKCNNLYAERRKMNEKITQEYSAKISAVEAEYETKLIELEQQFDMMKKMSSGEVVEPAA